MQNETVARRYAHAILSLAKERSAVSEIGQDLDAAAAAIADSDDLRRFFVSPVVERQKKLAVFEKALASFNEVARFAVLLLIRKRREALLAPIVVEYAKLALADAGKERLEVASARALPAAELDRIVSRLSRLYKKSFDVQRTVDPALLGGVRITMGDRRIDATISGRLDEFARELHRQKDLSI
jgi:F-type H+-transporting ATPase subunit delta